MGKKRRHSEEESRPRNSEEEFRPRNSEDGSRPRKKRHSEDESRSRKKRRHSEDESRSRNTEDESRPRNSEEESRPRKKRHSEDESRPRKKRRHSEVESRSRKKHKLESDPDAAAIWGGQEGRWTETVRRKMKAEVPELMVETDRMEKHQHKHKHKHKHRPKYTAEDNLQGTKTEETMCISGSGGGVEWEEGGDGEREAGGSGGMEGNGCSVRRKHKTKHKKRHHKPAMVDEAEPDAAPDPVWAAISIDGESSESEDEFSVLHTMWTCPSREEDPKFWEQVGSWKQGRWTVPEIRRLKKNVSGFMKEHGIKDLIDFIFNNRYQHRDFYHYIAKNINRPLFPIYRKMLRVFDVANFVGRWTKEMERELHRLHKLHGNRWRDVGRTLGVSGQAALDKFRSMCDGYNKGEWSEEEEQKLAEAMEYFRSGEDGDDLCLPPSVTWEKVAERVGTRNLAQCRRKWLYHLSWKEKGGKQMWTSRDDLTLLQQLAAVEVVDEEEVEWEEMCEGWDSARSPYFLRVRWSALRREVPNYRLMTFQENLEYLLAFKVPELEKQSTRLFN